MVSCQQTDTDRYGRVVADCFVGRESLNNWMVREGWAVAYRQYSIAYIAAQKSSAANMLSRVTMRESKKKTADSC